MDYFKMNYTNTFMDKEKTDLELHVDLCAQRYAELDKRLGSLEEKMDDVKDSIDENRTIIVKSFIATAGTIVVALCGLAGVILTSLPH